MVLWIKDWFEDVKMLLQIREKDATLMMCVTWIEVVLSDCSYWSLLEYLCVFHSYRKIS